MTNNHTDQSFNSLSDKLPPLPPESRSDTFASEFIHSLEGSARDRQRFIPNLMTVDEYLTRLAQNPYVYLRSPHTYAADALRSRGATEAIKQGQKVTVFAAANWPWGSPTEQKTKQVIGLDPSLSLLELRLRELGRESHGNKMIVLHGNFGSGKTLLIHTLFAALEDYSRNHPDGIRCRLVFVFPNNKSKGGPISLQREQFAVSSEVGFTITSSFSTNPFFLLSKVRTDALTPSPREALFTKLCESEAGKKSPLLSDCANWALSSELDITSQQVLDTLLRHYNGDIRAVINSHVRVEPYFVSMKDGIGAVFVTRTDKLSRGEPLLPKAVDDHNRYTPLELENSAAHITEITGAFPAAAGGALCFDNFLGGKRPLATYEKLQEDIESGRLSVGHADGRVLFPRHNAVILATAADPNLEVTEKSDAEWPSYFGRFAFIPVPGRLSYLDEKRLLERKLDLELPLKSQRDPYALDFLSLFTCCTRMFEPLSTNYGEDYKKIAETIRKYEIGVVEKALILESAGFDINLCRQEKRGDMGNRDGWLDGQTVAFLYNHSEKIAREYASASEKSQVFRLRWWTWHLRARSIRCPFPANSRSEGALTHNC